MATDKMRELVLYISRKCEDDRAFGSIKLNKILFYADFEAYQKRHRAITGQQYFRLDEGPAPRCMKPLLSKMVADGVLRLDPVRFYNWWQKRPVPLREPNLDGFTEEELAIVDKYIKGLWGKTGKQVSKMSHEFIGWRLAIDKEDIPYCTAFSVPVGVLTEKEKAIGESLRSSIGEIRASLQ